MPQQSVINMCQKRNNMLFCSLLILKAHPVPKAITSNSSDKAHTLKAEACMRSGKPLIIATQRQPAPLKLFDLSVIQTIKRFVH